MEKVLVTDDLDNMGCAVCGERPGGQHPHYLTAKCHNMGLETRYLEDVGLLELACYVCGKHVCYVAVGDDAKGVTIRCHSMGVEAAYHKDFHALEVTCYICGEKAGRMTVEDDYDYDRLAGLDY